MSAMQSRREFLRTAFMGGAAYWLPWNKVAGFSIAPAQQVRAAHLEKFSKNKLSLLYTRHAEVAKDIHVESARRMSGVEIPVDLLEISGSIPEISDLEIMSKLNVFSVSSNLSESNSTIGEELEENLPACKNFWKNSNAIGVFSAGNSGESKSLVPFDTIENFADTALSVGEVGKTRSGEWFVKSHSQKVGNISLVAPNITDQGFKVQYFDQSPKITEEHKELVRDWRRNKDIFSLLAEENVDFESKTVSQKADLFIKKSDELEKDEVYKERLQKAVDSYLANTETLHQDFLAEFRESGFLGEDGLTAKIEGTSFTAPYVAGAITAACAIGKIREEEGKPALTSQELVGLALLACDPVSKLEDNQDIPQEKNSRGLVSSHRAGFGVFNLQKYKSLVTEAYQELDKNPALASKAEIIEEPMKVRDKKDNLFEIVMPRESKEKIATRIRFEYKTSDIPPISIFVKSPDGKEFYLNATQGSNMQIESVDDATFHSWAVTDRFLGEPVDGIWEVKLLDDNRREIKAEDMKLVINTANKGCLLDMMIDKQLAKQTERKR